MACLYYTIFQAELSVHEKLVIHLNTVVHNETLF